jgi:radical SAM superfamily enzyme YgiQ (UPF0313 family)
MTDQKTPNFQVFSHEGGVIEPYGDLQPGYYWTGKGEPDDKIHGPFGHPSDAAFDAMDNGFDAELLGEGTITTEQLQRFSDLTG